MMGNIAVAVDGTEESRAALKFAVDLARREEASLTGVFVMDAGWADFIGNDWQSSRNARQGFLDYVLQDQRRHADLARAQFGAASRELLNASFSLLVDEPANALVQLMKNGSADALVAGRKVFQACGRPSAKALAKILTRKVRQPLFLL